MGQSQKFACMTNILRVSVRYSLKIRVKQTWLFKCLMEDCLGKKIMTVETWDGKSKFKTEESKQEESERLKQWEKYLEDENVSEVQFSIMSKDADKCSEESAS